MSTPVKVRRLVWTGANDKSGPHTCPGLKGLQNIVRTEQESWFAPHSQAQAAPNVSEKEVREGQTLACLLHHHLLVQLRALDQLAQPPPSVSGRPKTMGRHSGSLFSSTKHSALESCPPTIECPGEATQALVTWATMERT